MSQINQIILDREGVCKIIAEHFAAKLPPGMISNTEVYFFGTHPKKRTQRTAVTKETIAERYLKKEQAGSDSSFEANVLADVGAIVILDPQPKA